MLDKIFVLKKKKVGVKAKNKAETKAILLPNIFLAIRQVKYTEPTPNNNSKIFPKITIFKPIFQINPKNKGSIIGLAGSQKPAFPEE